MDLFTNLVIKCSFVLYEIYAKIAYSAAVLFPNFTKYVVDKVAYHVYGITINGPGLNDAKVLVPEKFYPRVVSYFGYGVAEGYANKEWHTDDLVGATVKIIKTNRFGSMLHPLRHIMKRLNLHSQTKAWEVGTHYNVGNYLFETVLDKNLQYSSGYWRNARNLGEAELAKMDLIGRKLQLKPGMRVLDIGCGFGTLACHLAKNFGVSVVGCTISKEQFKYFQEHFEGSLPVEVRLCDYRDMNEKFDRITSVSMIEHVGPKNYDTFMAVAHRCLTDDGILLIESWGVSDHLFPNFDMWLSHMVPNMTIPYFYQIWNMVKTQWVIEDWHNMSQDIIKTFAAMRENTEKAWPKLQSKFGERFCRAYLFLLSIFQGLYVSKKFQHIQIVLRKMENLEDYAAVR